MPLILLGCLVFWGIATAYFFFKWMDIVHTKTHSEILAVLSIPAFFILLGLIWEAIKAIV